MVYKGVMVFQRGYGNIQGALEFYRSYGIFKRIINCYLCLERYLALYIVDHLCQMDIYFLGLVKELLVSDIWDLVNLQNRLNLFFVLYS